MHTVQMGKLWYKAINIIVCLWNNKKIKENKTNTYSAKKIFSHPNSMIKILSAKKKIFFRFQLYAWGYCVYMDTMLLDRREYPVNKENTCSKWNLLPLLPTKKSHNTLYISEINSWWIMSLNILMILSSTMVKWILSSGRPVLIMKSKTFLLYFC